MVKANCRHQLLICETIWCRNQCWQSYTWQASMNSTSIAGEHSNKDEQKVSLSKFSGNRQRYETNEETHDKINIHLTTSTGRSSDSNWRQVEYRDISALSYIAGGHAIKETCFTKPTKTVKARSARWRLSKKPAVRWKHTFTYYRQVYYVDIMPSWHQLASAESRTIWSILVSHCWN